MDTRRLKLVRDMCPLSPERHRWLYASAWMKKIRPSDFVVQNKFISWRRTFTKDGVTPNLQPTNSYLTIDEWAPSVWPRAHAGWRHFGIQHREAIVFLDEPRAWSSQARRHLGVCKKNNITFRLGTFSEFENNMSDSQVPPRLQKVFIEEVRRHTNTHPETIDFLIAEHGGEIVSCFVAASLDEIKQSYYLAGYFKRGTEKMHAKVGLIDWWFAQSLEKKYATLNFGHIVGPYSIPGTETGTGYSNFKTHFGATRVWWPGSFWKLTWRTQTLQK
jgi:hypothetical protein